MSKQDVFQKQLLQVQNNAFTTIFLTLSSIHRLFFQYF